MRVDTGRLRVVAAQPVAALQPSDDAGAALEPSVDDATTAGSYIRAHRKRQGLSLDQLAVATKIPRRQLELLEEDRHDELPGMVFIKGFLRCCARSLELDPDTVQGLLYDQEREQLRTRRREAADAESNLRAAKTPRAYQARAKLERSKNKKASEPVRPGLRAPSLARPARTEERPVRRGPAALAEPKPSASKPPRSLADAQVANLPLLPPALAESLDGLRRRVREWAVDWVARLPMAQIVLWVVVALAVALIVLAAFSLASGQAAGVSPGTGGL